MARRAIQRDLYNRDFNLKKPYSLIGSNGKLKAVPVKAPVKLGMVSEEDGEDREVEAPSPVINNPDAQEEESETLDLISRVADLAIESEVDEVEINIEEVIEIEEVEEVVEVEAAQVEKKALPKKKPKKKSTSKKRGRPSKKSTKKRD